jgi:hypothetical protein
MKKKLNNFFMIYIMVCAEAITIGRLLPSIFLGQAIIGLFYSQIFFLGSGHVNPVRNLLESIKLCLCL